MIDEPGKGDEGGFRMGEDVFEGLVIGFFRNGGTGCIFVGYMRTAGVILEGMGRGDGFRMDRPVLQGNGEVRGAIFCAVSVFVGEGVPLDAIDAVHAHRHVVRHHDVGFGALIGP